jgi:carbon-monoxide dehydrogenase medium subunit
MPSEIVRPKNLKELWRLLPSFGPSRKYLAGGTDLVNAENAGIEKSRVWVDLGAVRELGGIRETRSSIVIGAGVKIAELETSSLVRRWLPALFCAVPHFASPSLRNMATVGGNAANASPCADAVCALCAENARIKLELKGARRELELHRFFKGPKRTLLKKDELITAFEIPKREHRGVYLKLGPRAYFGISKAAVALALEMDGDRIKSAGVSLASVAPVPLVAAKTSAYLVGRILNAENARTAAALVKTEVSPITDARSEAEYRREMCGVLLERALNRLKG